MAKGHSAPAILQMARVEGRQMIDKKKKQKHETKQPESRSSLHDLPTMVTAWRVEENMHSVKNE